MFPELHPTFPESHPMFPESHPMFPESHPIFPTDERSVLLEVSKPDCGVGQHGLRLLVLPDQERAKPWPTEGSRIRAFGSGSDFGSGAGVRLCCVDVKGYSVDVKGYSVDVKGYSLDVKGYSVDVKGYSLDVKGYSLDVKGYSEDVVTRGLKQGPA
eukprot:1186486-Prorocentrum_minimum.AAC.1